MYFRAIKNLLHYNPRCAASLRGTVLALSFCCAWTASLASNARGEVTDCAADGKRDSYISASKDKLSIGNSLVSRSVAISQGRALPSAILNKVTGKTLESAEEFALTLSGGRRVSSSEFVYAGRIPQEFDGGRCKITLSYYNEELSIDAQAVFWVMPNSNLIRKYIRLRSSSARPVYIESATVEHFKSPGDAGSGGLGQPLFLDGSFFAGLEFPAGYNIPDGGGATITHRPGWTLGQEWKKSQTAATGVSNDGENRSFFMQYVNSIAMKPRPYTRRYDDLSALSRSDFLYGSGGKKQTADMSFANIDWQLELSDVKHTQSSYNRRAEEFATELIGKVETARAANPDMFISIDSHMWLSPWWLPYFDGAKIDERVFGFDYGAPAAYAVDRATTYDDDAMRRLFNDGNLQFPLWALMSRGVFDGRYELLISGNEDLFSLPDNLMARFGRGSISHEIYLTPGAEGSKLKPMIEDMLRWAESRAGLFASGTMQGANPSSGSPYWFQFSDNDSDLITIRHPGYVPASVQVQLRSPENIARMTYPYHKWLPTRQVGAGGALNYDLPGRGVTVLESMPQSALKRPAIMGVRSRITRQTDTETEYELAGMPGNTNFNIFSNAGIGDALFNGAALSPDEDGYYHARLEGLSPANNDAPIEAIALQDHDYYKVKIDTSSAATANMVELKHIMVVTCDSPAVPSQVIFDGAATGAVSAGRGWSVFEFPIGFGSEIHHIEFTPESIAAAPFATSSFTVDFMTSGFLKAATGSLVVKHASAPIDETALPPAPMQNFIRYLKPEFYHLQYSLEDIMKLRAYPADKTFVPGAARIHIRMTGSEYDSARAVLINGSRAAALPANSFPYNTWEDFVLVVGPDALKDIRKDNFVVITGGGGKVNFSELAISIQLPGGSWLNTPYDGAAQYSGGDWAGAEGAKFVGDSRPVRLSFP